MQTISRLYATEENARKAWDELKRRGFADVHLFTPPPRGEDGAPAGASAESLLDGMTKAYIARSDAAILARRVGEGASLVTVHAPFTGGLKATTIVDRHGPIESGIPEPASPSYAWDDEHPFSSAFRLPLLTKCEHPFEFIFGLPSLIKTSYATGGRPQPDNPAPFSAALGLPVLSNEPAPLSSFFKFPVLTKSGPLFYR
ncbi:MAG: hypothetical protein C0519_12890 [Hyphomicrobium sp.]|nr:hypothetical protein [Hyphomicrobium sp.]PPD09085.1 MAG: hypothetical protein CTY28_03260 [Hyphomicrobium sp.]